MKTPLIFCICSLLCLILDSCFDQDKNIHIQRINTYNSLEDTLYLPFDTARVLRLYNIPTEFNQIEKFRNEKINGLNDKLDTLKLFFANLACDCPDWYDVSLTPTKASSEMSPSYAYYIEAASSQLKLPETIRQCTILLIGRHYETKGFPRNNEFMDPHPPAGNVFRYYAYEMLSPTVIYGPPYHTGEKEIPTDTVEMINNSLLILK